MVPLQSPDYNNLWTSPFVIISRRAPVLRGLMDPVMLDSGVASRPLCALLLLIGPHTSDMVIISSRAPEFWEPTSLDLSNSVLRLKVAAAEEFAASVP